MNEGAIMARLVTTDKKKPRLKVVEPRTRRRITPQEIEAGLDAERVGKVPSGGSPMSAYAVRQELFRRLRSTGGRPGLNGADIKPKIPMRASEWKKLEELARLVETQNSRPTAAQLASVLLSAAIRQFEPREEMPDNAAGYAGKEGWTRERIAIRQLLSDRAPPLVSLYEAAVKMLHDETFPARRYLIAHCIREIANSLLTYLGEWSGKQRQRVEYGELIKPIVGPWRAAGLPLGAETPPVALTENERHEVGTPFVSIPTTIVREISRVLEAYAEGSERRQRDAFLLFQALSEDRDEADASRLWPITRWWLRTCNWFVGRAHHSRRPESELTEEVDSAFVAHFESFEGLLYTMVEPFFDIAKRLDEDLEQATSEQVDHVVSKLGRPGAYRYFFSRLQNPEWIQPLRARGYFSHPPAIRRDELRGTVAIPDWPALDYLARVAPEAPELVADIVLELPETDNERVRQGVVRIALNLPPAVAGKLTARVVSWFPASDIALTFSLDASKLVAHLAGGGQTREAFKLAEAVLGIGENTSATDSNENDALLKTATSRSAMDLWEYNEALKICVASLARVNGARTINLLCRLLTAALSASNLILEDGRKGDFSHLRADDLYAADDALTSFEGLLARTLGRVAIEIARGDEGCAEKIISAIEGRTWSIFRLVALHVLANLGTLAPSVARERIVDKRLFDEASTQYGQLLRARFGQLTAEEQATILGWIVEGPDVEKWASNYKEFYGRPASDAELEPARKIWIRDRLLWLGDNLPADKKRVLEDLVAAVGEPQREPMIGTSWWTPASPKSDEDFNSTPISELVDYLNSWRPAESAQNQGTRIGLAKQLQAAATRNPTGFAQAAETFIGLEPTYVHHLIWGLEEAVRGGATFNWPPVLALCGWVVWQPRADEPDVPFPLREHEETWAGARRAAMRLVDLGLQRTLIPDDQRNDVWDIIQTLAQDPEPTLKDEDARGASADPTTTSLNTIRGQAMHAAMKYARWIRQLLDQASPGRSRSFDDMPEVRELLDQRLDPLREETATIRSLYGQYFPLLTYLDRSWAADNVTRIFQRSEPRYWNAAWTAYMQFGGAYDDVFRLLREQYAIAVESLPQHSQEQERDAAVEHLGSHLMVFYWRNLITLREDDLVLQFFSKVAPPFRKRALEFVGRSLINTKDEVPPEVLQRLIGLWESRVRLARQSEDRRGSSVELSGFGTWFLSGKFADRWTIEQLLALFDLIEIDALNAYPVIRRLAEISDKMPSEAVRCLEAFVLGSQRNWLYVSGMAEVGTVLQSAIDNGDPVARRVAVRIIERLAERGDMSYRHLVPNQL